MDLSTGYPFWLINSGLPAQYPSLEASHKTDVLIIGGGISGALVAYFLVHSGVQCTLVDGRTIGLGSTSASTSLLQYELDKPLSELSMQIGYSSASRAYQKCAEAIDTLKGLSEKLKFTSFEKQRSLYFAATQKDKKRLETEFLFRKKAGFKVQLLDEYEIHQQFGFKAPLGILSSKAASTDAYLFTHCLLKNSVRKGLQVFDRTQVSKIEYKKNGVQVLTKNGNYISAKKIVNATGYEIKEFIEKKIVTLNSTYAFATEHLNSSNTFDFNKTLLWNTAEPYLYMRTTKDNRIIVGGRDEKFYNPEIRDKLIKDKTIRLRKDFLKLFPGVDIIPEFSWTGTFGSTKDALPYIGLYPKTPHTYYALGFGGNGITFSVIAAEMIRDWIVGKPNKDASLFAFDR